MYNIAFHAIVSSGKSPTIILLCLLSIATPFITHVLYPPQFSNEHWLLSTTSIGIMLTTLLRSTGSGLNGYSIYFSFAFPKSTRYNLSDTNTLLVLESCTITPKAASSSRILRMKSCSSDTSATLLGFQGSTKQCFV